MNAAQRAAVERWGQDVCVVAGPGSGKTRVLIERFRWLVGEKGIDPRRILAVTFTEKAATEIKRRLIETFGASDALREQMERAWVSTIHGFCTRLLKENAIAAGVDPNFGLLDEAESKFHGRRVAEAVLDDLLVLRPAAMRTLLTEVNTGMDDLAGALLKLHEETRTAGFAAGDLGIQPLPPDDGWQRIRAHARLALHDPPDGSLNQRQKHQAMHRWAEHVRALSPDASWRERVQLLEQMPRASSLKAGSRVRGLAQELEESFIPAAAGALVLTAHLSVYPVILEALRRIDDAYRDEKRTRGVLDFEDLQECAIRLLESNEALRGRIRGSFDQVLMDELQDTNRLQWRLVDLVRKPGSLFAVGDINQSIYYFRHADPEVFRNYRDALHAGGQLVDELRENYRSRPEIIAAVNAIVPFLPAGVEPHRLVARRTHAAKTGASVELLHTFAGSTEENPARTEARWIARRIRELESTTAANFSDIAVLARTIGTLAPVQEALDEFGIPSSVSGGKSFYETREVRDLVAWLRVLANPRDEVSLAVVLRSPLAGVSDETLFRLRRKDADLFTATENELDPAVSAFRTLVVAQRTRMHAVPPDALVAEVLDSTGYEHGLAPRAKANIAKFLSMLRDWHSRRPLTMGELVDDLRNWRDTGSEAEAASGEAGNSVRLMSVHAAKGLEFPIVFVAGMRTGGQNREPVFCFDETLALGVSWKHPGGGRGLSDPLHLRVCDRKRRQEEGEEDRLLYVAMTRAEEHLVFSASPGGKLPWMRNVSDALGLPSAAPKQEQNGTHSLLDGTRIAVTYTAQPAVNNFETAAAPLTEETIYTELPVMTGQHESVAPVTSVALHAFCPRQYFLSRYLRYPVEAAAAGKDPEEPLRDSGEWTATELGTMVHELLAGKFSGEPAAEAVAMAQGFSASALGRRAAAAQRKGTEYDFLIEVEGLILRGQIDLWFEEGGELILVDYKSDRVESGQERVHSFRYGPQLRIYALALRQLTGRLPDRAVVWYLRMGTAVDISLRQEWMNAAREQVAGLRNAQESMSFPLREGPHCVRCNYFGAACPAKLPQGLEKLEAVPKSTV